ncbi:DMT family transporter [Mesorhizobium sp. M1169]|uniref:DMT family transporter n=1 Tax=Mesorhizobium sp. M1169 TaxID=2957066 RepID=UPI00333594C6
MNPSILLLSAALAGAILPFQAGANAALAKSFGHPLTATAASLIVSIGLLLPILACLRTEVPGWRILLSPPGWAWAGGVVGVIFLTASLHIAPIVGATAFVALAVCGQLVSSLLIDYFGAFGFAPKEINPLRVIGVALMVAGVGCVHLGTKHLAPAQSNEAPVR